MSEALEARIAKLDQTLNEIGIQLLANHPQAQRLAGQRDILAEQVKERYENERSFGEACIDNDNASLVETEA